MFRHPEPRVGDQLRLIRLGEDAPVAPLAFHATYTGLAYAMAGDATPALLWGRVATHLCLGQSQGLCEIDPDNVVPVVRRPLGGGLVWVDPMQHCYALVVPLAQAPQYPAAWFRWALAPACATYRRFGLPAGFVGNDLWVRGRKIAGSGAATVGRCAVVASSFLLHFPAARFAAAVSAPHAAYRAQLVRALAGAVTDWQREGTPPPEAELRAAFMETVNESHGWTAREDCTTPAEQAAVADAATELAEPIDWGRRLVPGGIKLNHRNYLLPADGDGRRFQLAASPGALEAVS